MTMFNAKIDIYDFKRYVTTNTAKEEAGMSVEENKAIVRRYIDVVINQHRQALIDELFAPEMPERVRGVLTLENNPFPDAHEEIEELVGEGDKVMARLVFRATHTGEFMGVPATDKAIEIVGYGTYQLKDRQIVWDTICFDWLEALDQIGVTKYTLDQT